MTGIGTRVARTEAFRAITEIWVRDNPAHVITSPEQWPIDRPELHGVVRTAHTNVLLGQGVEREVIRT